MMNGWLALDRIAASHGDGLTSSLRNLLNRETGIAEPEGKVINLSSKRGRERIVAGPAPGSKTPGELPENVVRFQGRAR